MSFDLNNIIQVSTFIVPNGLGYANFAKAVLFAPEAELPVGFDTDTYRDYSTLSELSEDFASSTETYKAAARWLGGIPAPQQLRVWGVDALDASWEDTLNKAVNEIWWYLSFFTAPVYADEADVLEIAAWHDPNVAFFVNCQTGASANKIRDPGDATDIATQLTTLGYRHVHTFTHATDPYAGIALMTWFASVNYGAAGSTITGEYKKLAGVAAESLKTTEYNAMMDQTKKSGFYSVVELQGSVDAGRVINSVTHSTFGEFIDDVINLDAFVNNLKVDLYNAIANQPKKLGQDPNGQAVLINAAKVVCQRYVANDYLGPRNYIDPDDGQEKFTFGWEILSKPEEILSLTDPDREARKSAPLRVRIFRKGAIHNAAVDISVY